MADVLARIVARKRREVAARLDGPVPAEPTTRSLRAALARRGARFIMEVKRASPSSQRGQVEAAVAAYAPVPMRQRADDGADFALARRPAFVRSAVEGPSSTRISRRRRTVSEARAPAPTPLLAMCRCRRRDCGGGARRGERWDGEIVECRTRELYARWRLDNNLRGINNVIETRGTTCVTSGSPARPAECCLLRKRAFRRAPMSSERPMPTASSRSA